MESLESDTDEKMASLLSILSKVHFDFQKSCFITLIFANTRFYNSNIN